MATERSEVIPSWDGTPEDFDEYDSKTFWYVRGCKPWEQEQATSKLIMRLKGKAWDAVMAIPEHERGTMLNTRVALMHFLKKSLMESSIPEAGRHFREYLLKFRRQKNESMKLFCQRHKKQLLKLEATVKIINEGDESLKLKILTKVKNQSFSATYATGSADATGRKSRVWRSNGSKAGSDNMSQAEEKNWDGEGWEDWGEGFDSATAEVSHPSWHTKPMSATGRKVEDQAPAIVRANEAELIQELVEVGEILGARNPLFLRVLNQIQAGWKEGILPSVLSGWVLLNKAGLTGQERATVLAASGMSGRGPALKLENVETALKQQWEDAELKDRDGRTRPASGHGVFDSDEEMIPAEPEAEANKAASESGESSDVHSDEIAALLGSSCEEDDRTALAEAYQIMRTSRDTMKKARRSFTQAKALVRDVKKQRKGNFFRRKDSAAAHAANELRLKVKNMTRPQNNAKDGLCFRCGKKGHIAKDCKQPPPTTQKAHFAEEAFMNASADDEEIARLEKQIRIAKLRKELAELETAMPPPPVPVPRITESRKSPSTASEVLAEGRTPSSRDQRSRRGDSRDRGRRRRSRSPERRSSRTEQSRESSRRSRDRSRSYGKSSSSRTVVMEEVPRSQKRSRAWADETESEGSCSRSYRSGEPILAPKRPAPVAPEAWVPQLPEASREPQEAKSQARPTPDLRPRQEETEGKGGKGKSHKGKGKGKEKGKEKGKGKQKAKEKAKEKAQEKPEKEKPDSSIIGSPSVSPERLMETSDVQSGRTEEMNAVAAARRLQVRQQSPAKGRHKFRKRTRHEIIRRGIWPSGVRKAGFEETEVSPVWSRDYRDSLQHLLIRDKDKASLPEIVFCSRRNHLKAPSEYIDSEEEPTGRGRRDDSSSSEEDHDEVAKQHLQQLDLDKAKALAEADLAAELDATAAEAIQAAVKTEEEVEEVMESRTGSPESAVGNAKATTEMTPKTETAAMIETIILAEEAYGLSESETGKFAIIDSGATSTLASVAAMEQIPQEAILGIDPTIRRRYRFGNGQEAVTSSQVTMKLGGKELQVDVLETERLVPMLLSIKWLAKNRAILDCGNGTLQLEDRMIKLERSRSGHLLLPLDMPADEAANNISEETEATKQSAGTGSDENS